ncbi:MAG: hypothetical protein ACI4QW_06180 [Clostridia bacterium]
MKFDWKKISGQIMNTRGLVIIFMIGIGLLLIPGLLPGKAKQTADAPSVGQVFDRTAYEKELETRLADILSTLRGVTNVSVMITLEDSGETYYARNEKSDEKNTADGSLREDVSQSDASLALKSEAGGGQSPVLLKTGMPRVSGVLVTAKGVGDPAVQADVVGAVRAVLDVAVHRVQVLEKS